METNIKVRRKIKIATILLSVEILSSSLSLSTNSYAPIASIIIASVLIYLIHKMTKGAYNNARILLLIIFLSSSMANGFTYDSQHPVLFMIIYFFEIVLWATVFFLVNSVYKQLFSKKSALEQNTSLSIPGMIQPIDLNKKINPKILILIFAAPIVIALIVALVSWLFNSN